METLITSLRLAVATLLICVAGYSTVIWALAQIVSPDTARGSLIRNESGQVIGSRLIAQKFTREACFWPRPSAVDYNAEGAGGSNKSPTSSDLTERARQTVAQYRATAGNPLPAELAAASGGGLDPHITEAAASYQSARVAKALGLNKEQMNQLIAQHAFRPGGIFTPGRIVNVLELNLALDRAVP